MKFVGEHKNKSGIYYIYNIVTNKFYVGSAKNFKRRFNQHTSLLKRNKHPNIKLQRSFNKHGLLNFEFRIVEFVENFDLLIEYEQKHIDVNKPHICGYNIAPIAGNTYGVPCKEETKLFFKETMSGKNGYWYGKDFTLEHRKNIGDAERGEKNHYYGKNLNIEHREKIKKAQQGEKGNNSILKENEVIDIRNKYLTGKYTQNMLAVKYNISRQAISKIIYRKTWKHI